MKYQNKTLLIGLILAGKLTSGCVVESGDDEGGGGRSSTAGQPQSAGAANTGGRETGSLAGMGGESVTAEGGMGGESVTAEGGMGGESVTAEGGMGGDPVTAEGGMGGEPVSPEGGMGGSGGIVSPGGWMHCDDRGISDATTISGDIRENQVWSGRVYVESSVDVYDGARITIEPGTDIIMGVDSDIEFGWNGGAVTVFARGTEAAPIRFCGEVPDAGYWGQLVFGANVTSDSVMEHVLVADAGGEAESLLFASAVTVHDLQIRNSGGDGVRAADFGEDSTELSVEGAEGAAAVLTHSDAVTHFPLGGRFEANQDNSVHLVFGDILTDTLFHEVGLPYVQEDAVSVYDGAEITFEPGVEYQFLADANLEIGWNSGDAAVFANGTADAPVVFRGEQALAGFWRGIQVRSNVRTNSVLSNVIIRHGGGEDVAALSIEAPIRLEQVSLEENATGAYVGARGVADESADLSITDTTGGVPLTVEPNALITLPEGGTFVGNQSDYIAVRGGSYDESGTVPNLGVPYLILDSIDTLAGSSITLLPGTHFVMNANADIEFGWNAGAARVVALGTETEPIRFTALDDEPASWPGLTVGTGVLSSSAFDQIQVSHAAPSCLSVGREVAVANSTFSDCEIGILKSASDATDYTVSNTFTNVTTAVANR